jgi:hypothetical protein
MISEIGKLNRYVGIGIGIGIGIGMEGELDGDRYKRDHGE